MALQYVGGQVVNAIGQTGTFDITFALTGGLASTPAEGDVVFVGIAHGGTVDRDLTVSGYEEVADLYFNDSNDVNHGVFWKRMGATPDTLVTVPYSQDSAEGSSYAIHVWRGVDPTTPFDVTTVTATGGDSALPDPAAITPATQGAVILVFGAGTSGTGANFVASDLSNFITTFGNDTYDGIIGVGSKAWTSGAFNPAAWTGPAVNASDSWAAVTIALRPEQIFASAALTASGSLAATGSRVAPASAAIAASASLAASAVRIGNASALRKATATLTATAKRTAARTAVLSASSKLVALARKVGFSAYGWTHHVWMTRTWERTTGDGVAVITASASLTSSAGATRPVTASLSSTATLSATATRTRARSAALAGSGALALTPQRIRARSAALISAASISADPGALFVRAAALSSSSFVSVTADKIVSIIMRPDADLATNGWTAVGATSLYQALDEVEASDDEYIVSPNIPNGEECEFSITGGEEIVAPTSFRYRAAKSGGATTLTIRLMEGATERATRSRALTDTLTDYEDFLTPLEIASVTDWAAVSIRISAA